MNLQELNSIISNIQSGQPGWSFITGYYDSAKTIMFLQISCENGICNVTGSPLAWKGRKYVISKYACESEIVNTALNAVITAMEHEIRERFRYKEKMVFNPHISINALVSVCDIMETREGSSISK